MKFVNIAEAWLRVVKTTLLPNGGSPFVVVVNGDRQDFFRLVLADDVAVQILPDLLGWRRGFSLLVQLLAGTLALDGLLDRFLGVGFGKDDEEMVAFFAFDKPEIETPRIRQ